MTATSRATTEGPAPAALERRGRWWIALSFLACPCHLPLTLGLLGAVAGGTAVGAALLDRPVLAGTVIAAVWLAGTARGLWLVRRAERGELACALPGAPRRRPFHLR